MAVTDSLKFYCQIVQQRTAQPLQDGNSDHFEEPYVRLVTLAVYELFTQKTSSLLSYLCTVNDVFAETVNFRIIDYKYNFKETFDIVPVLEGMNMALTKGLDKCGRLYTDNYGKDAFRRMGFAQGSDYKSKITCDLMKLDENIGKIVLGVNGKQEGLEQKCAVEMRKGPESIAGGAMSPVPSLTTADRLDKYARERSVRDQALSGQIQQLQVSLQDGLKQIMLIRDGIDYSMNQEAVSQLILLFHLMDETLQYHPDDAEEESYHNLVDSCRDFLENIRQSLTMLGVTIIDGAGEPFNVERHRPVQGKLLSRKATVSKVVKTGFMYKGRVIEKAEVEVTEDSV